MAGKAKGRLFGLSIRRQADISTANVSASYVRFNKLNYSPLNPQFRRENDAAEYGKGHEFATASYKVQQEVPKNTLEKYVSAELVALATTFGLGSTVKSGTSPNFVYTSVPASQTTDFEPYYLSVTEQQSAVSVDRTAVGCAVDSFRVVLANQAGRESAKLSLGLICSGLLTEPSGITLPDRMTEHEMPFSTLALTIMGTAYDNKDILEVEWGWENNSQVDSSGLQNGFTVGGRIERGERTPVLRAKVRMSSSSTEYTKLKAGTTGTVVVAQTYDTNNGYVATFQQAEIASVADSEGPNGVVVLDIQFTPQFHATNGLLSVVAKCGVDGICQAEV